jgi:nucleotide-binding universal stress UspA family protein
VTIGTILVPLLGDAGDGDGLTWAGSLARRHHAHITALHPSPNPSDALFALASTTPEVYITESMERTVRDQTTARRAAVKRRYTAWAEAEGVACAGNPGQQGSPAAKLIVDAEVTEASVFRHALVADLVVNVLPGKGMERRLEPLNASLFDAGRPVLGVPPGSTPFGEGLPAIVAWNGSSEGARALVAAVPLLKESSEVVVVHAGAPDTVASLESVTDYLARHQIKGRGIELGEGNASDLLSDQISRIGAGLLVMGAYSHSRLREFVLGGVTRDMLANPPAALLLSH